ncbi:MAG TPA: recombination regulator RecX [Burkholderiaceae bacterium]|nr:recombination regulator RecX [Burkholderiaceae bacterium]
MSAPDEDFETLAGKTAPEGPSSEEPAVAKRGGRPGPSLKARAIAILSRRENSRLELERKLAPHATDALQLQQLLDELERENWLSNERYALSLVNRRAPRQGSRRIVQELRQQGLSDDIIAGINESLKETELDRAREVWLKKFGAAPVDAKDYARQFRFLASRGFSSECLRRILGDLSDSS